ncbi:MAG: hypothetical protein IPN42_01100 [Methylococcaceae bacterium]|nr:hypothetical protein [Methylococcaceae bacterium]
MKKMILIAALLAQTNLINAGELISRRFEGSIRSNGIGDFSLMRRSTGDKLITATELEAFRKDNNGNLVFAVDVNESSKGSENRDSQGIAVQSAWIDVRINNVLYQFANFTTQTRSSLAAVGSTNRQMYYTLLGEAGSSRITSNNKSDIYGSSFDGTLTIPVNMDISKATSIWIHFRLLQTNTKLGDPESFYDFSGGFEDVAIVTKSDAAYLNILQAGRDRAPLVVANDAGSAVGSYAFYPSSSDYYLAAYEDQFPKPATTILTI